MIATRPWFAILSVMACGAESPAALPSATASPDSPAQLLGELDTRAPVPLLPQMAQHQKESMRDHLVAVQEIVSAIARDDFEAVENAGARLGSSEAMSHTCGQMGAFAPGFTEQATDFHRVADGIAAAARKRDGAGVLTSLSRTLAACTGCHASWKQEVVDAATMGELAR